VWRETVTERRTGVSQDRNSSSRTAKPDYALARLVGYLGNSRPDDAACAHPAIAGAHKAGFTLIEVLVAIVILGVVALLAYRATAAMNRREARPSTAESDRWRMLDRCSRGSRPTCGQAVPRRVPPRHGDRAGLVRPRPGDSPATARSSSPAPVPNLRASQGIAGSGSVIASATARSKRCIGPTR